MFLLRQLQHKRSSSSILTRSISVSKQKQTTTPIDETTTAAEDTLKVDYLKQTFAEFDRPNYHADTAVKYPFIEHLKQAAVLVPLTIKIERNEKRNYVQKCFYTLTKRPEHVRSFKGQVCFAGGKREESDKSLVETAFREANEETNIQPASQLSYIAQLSPVTPSTGILTTPVVAYFDKKRFEPKLAPNEVEMMFEMDTERFLSPDRHRFEVWSAKSGKLVDEKTEGKGIGGEYYVHYFTDTIEGKEVVTWGMTAFLCIICSSIIHSRPPPFPVDPQLELTNDNITRYLDEFVVQKSATSLEKIANKLKKDKLNKNKK